MYPVHSVAVLAVQGSKSGKIGTSGGGGGDDGPAKAHPRTALNPFSLTSCAYATSGPVDA